MPRLKKIVFDNIYEMLDFYNNNIDEIYELTLNKIEKHLEKHSSPKTLNLYEVKINNNPNIEYFSLINYQWEQCLLNMEAYYVRKENYEAANRVITAKNKLNNE